MSQAHGCAQERLRPSDCIVSFCIGSIVRELNKSENHKSSPPIRRHPEINSLETGEQSFTLYIFVTLGYRLFYGASNLPGMTANLPNGNADYLEPDR